jgi:hypothetical protein
VHGCQTKAGVFDNTPENALGIGVVSTADVIKPAIIPRRSGHGLMSFLARVRNCLTRLVLRLLIEVQIGSKAALSAGLSSREQAVKVYMRVRVVLHAYEDISASRGEGKTLGRQE